MRKRLVFLGILAFALAVSLEGFLNRAEIKNAFFAYQKGALPDAQPYVEFVSHETQEKNGGDQTSETEASMPNERPAPNEESLPSRINLAVPFTSQAPYANWALPYQEACEEASILMAARYKRGEPIRSPEDADQEIGRLVEFQNELFGDYQHTTAEQTAELARRFYGFSETYVKYHFTVEDIKRELAKGNPVIVPAAGRQLPNPYFRAPGPLYHMLVIRGYTEDVFITNDPGTKRGEEFTYSHQDLMNAVHDWNNGDVENGIPAMVVLR